LNATPRHQIRRDQESLKRGALAAKEAVIKVVRVDSGGADTRTNMAEHDVVRARVFMELLDILSNHSRDVTFSTSR